MKYIIECHKKSFKYGSRFHYSTLQYIFTEPLYNHKPTIFVLIVYWLNRLQIYDLFMI